ncbi:MAG TPA: ACT domain-containing protein [Dictyobacter sp.]|jgi:hypothetical protein|nr:ACT domain-containing protein [Dictyobacter sp.]
MSNQNKQHLSVLPEHYAICQLAADAPTPDWAQTQSSFVSITRTTEELSIMCPQKVVPEDVTCERNWRGLKIEGPFELSSLGILASVVTPLSGAGMSVFAVATYNTDHILIKEHELERAITILQQDGHTIR